MGTFSRGWTPILAILVCGLYSEVSPAHGLDYSADGCGALLGKGLVPVSPAIFHITSGTVSPSGTPLIESNNIWCAEKVDINQFLTVDLGKVMTIDRVAIGGKKGTTQSVSQYYVYTSDDGTNFFPIQEDYGPIKAFDGAINNGNQEVSTPFPAKRTRYVKFNPREPLRPDKAPHNLCMRIEIYGCTKDDASVDGGWTSWQQWSVCSQSCYGTKKRERYCTNPAPRNGGGPCQGHSSETQLCVHGCGVRIDGRWSSWESWSACSKSCGGGGRRRTRDCTNPAPINGGDPCFGPSSNTQSCNTQGCSVDGGWSDWNNWSACSYKCGGGEKLRFRSCSSPKPAYGGKVCSGDNVEKLVCNTHKCPVNGGWTDWSKISKCDKPCGRGQRNQTRTCTNPPPAYGGSQCAGDSKIIESCNTQACPVNGGWSLWTVWSSCSKSCGGGVREKTRSCTNPVPQYGGLGCQGSIKLTEACNTQNCPVDGRLSDWTQWSVCSKNCDGERSRSRDCSNPPPAYGGKLCNGITSETEKCGGACQVAVHGSWSIWSDWNKCSKSCGDGNKYHSRTCTNPPPSNGGNPCAGANNEIQVCNQKSCPVNGDWSSWGDWGQCGKTCGNGLQQRNRTCTNPRPAHNGQGCVGDDKDTRQCTVRACKVDGGFSQWTSWSDCSQRCGDGTKTRTRECNNPLPQNGGAACSGITSETLACNEVVCDVNGGWSSWGSFSSCSATCGGGEKTRMRTCNNPSPVSNGSPCRGRSIDTQSCNNKTCIEDGNWSTWGSWATCSKTCDQGSRSRVRNCTNPPPRGGGKDCDGSSYKSELCSFGPCPPTPTSKANLSTPLPDISDIDLLFVISATAVNADRTFDLIKDTIKSIVTKYGVVRIHYAAVVVGNVATVNFNFRSHFPDKESLTLAVSSLPRNVEDPNMDLGLEEAKRVFEGPGARIHAKRVMVIITDKGSPSKPKRLEHLAGQLEFIDVKIITVGIGIMVDVDQLVNITTRGVENHLGVNKSITPVVLGVKIMELVLKEDIPEIDLAFALSATSAKSSASFVLMKKTITLIVTRYGIDKIHHSFIVFGANANIKIDFGKTFPTKDALKRALDGIIKENGGPGLDKALEQAKSLFKSKGVRPNAKKVLVIIMDKASNVTETALVKKIRPLEDMGVLVISVGIGSEVKSAEFAVMSPNPKDVIVVPKDVAHTKLAVKVMERVLRVNIPEVDLAFALSADSVASEDIFALMKSIINAIIDRYGTDKLDFSVIVYGKVPTTSFNFGTRFPDKNSMKRSVDALPKREGPVNLEKALEEAHNLFTNTPTRPNAKKVLVVVTDVISEVSSDKLQLMTRTLVRNDIRIVSVAMGNENIVQQLQNVSFSADDVISVPNHKEKRPVELAEEIMVKVFLANVPHIDLTFAISATAANADETFTLMKEAVKSIIQTYGIIKIHYSVILFGSVAMTRVDFSRTFPNKEALVKIVERLRKSSGGPALESALQEAKKVYERSEVRPNARRVLVVILDKKSSSAGASLEKVAEKLRENKVFIVGVGIGKVDQGELEAITSSEHAIIRVAPDHQPADLAKKIMLAILSADGFSSWREWSVCSKTCRFLGVPGQQVRTRKCIYPELGCIGLRSQTRSCNEVDCDDCGEVGPLPNAAYRASSLSDNSAAPHGRLNASRVGDSKPIWCAEPGDTNSYLEIDLGDVYSVYGVITKGKNENPQTWVTQYRLRSSIDQEKWTYYEEDGKSKVFQGNLDARRVKSNLFNATRSVRYIRLEPVSWATQEKLPACLKAAVLACRAPDVPVTGQIDGGSANTVLLIALWILAGVLTFLLLLALLWFCCWYYCCGGKDRKRRQGTPTTLAGVSGGEGYLLDTMDGNRKWMLGPKILTHKGMGLPEDEVQEVSVEMGREYSEKPQGVIQFAIDAGAETEEESKFTSTVGGDNLKADKVRSQIPVYSSDGTLRSGVSMASLDGGYSSVDRRDRAVRQNGSMAAGGPGNWGYMTADRRGGGYSTVADQYVPGYATIGSGYVNGHRYRYVPEYTPAGYATVGTGGYRTEPGFTNIAYGGSQEQAFERQGSQRRKSTSDLLDTGLGQHEVTLMSEVERGGKTTEPTANGGYHTEEWYVRGQGPSTEEGYQEVQIEQQPIYSEVRKSNMNPFGHSRLI